MHLRQWSKDKLRLNDNKTEFMVIGTRKQLAKVNIDGLSVGENIMAPVTSVRNLGSWFDQNLSMTLHIKVARYSFQGQYLPSLSIKYVAINKDLEKLPPQLY